MPYQIPSLSRFLPQPVVAIATSILAAMALVVAYASYLQQPFNSVRLEGIPVLALTLALLVSVVLAHRFPIHLRYHLKVVMTSVPLYLMAVLLPPPLAATLAGVGVFTGELMVQAEKKNYPSDIATITNRWVLVTLIGSLVAQCPLLSSSDLPLSLVAAAVVMQTLDTLTVPLVLGPMCAERPAQLFLPLLRDGAVAEAAQYLLGIVGALAAERTLAALVLLALPTGLVYHALKITKEMHDSTKRLLESLADTVDLRDSYTGGHSRRVTDYAACILKELDLSGVERDLIITAARVHDIGKIGIPDAVLNKPGKLNPEERAMMETHAEQGAELLRRHADFSRGVGIVRHHHEAWDGSGYPHRLKGADIPFGARVIAVADSYDAMTSDRPYRAGMPPHKAAAILREGRGRQWDAEIVDAFLRGMAVQVSAPPAPHLHLVPLHDAGAAAVEAHA